jgi:hypothetical protein
MSMYGAMFGENSASDTILATLELTRKDVGRFRDAYVANGEIVIYTRNGGGNRECWNWNKDMEDGECDCPGCIINYRLPKHPLYIRDEDGEFDSTYATIYFKFPEEYATALAALDSGEPWDPDKRWLDLIESIKKT